MLDFEVRIMRKLKRSILFFVILGIILGGFSLWIRKEAVMNSIYILGRSRPFAEISKEKRDSVDLLVLGDSESYTSVSPLQLWEEQGMTAYVCGQPGQKIQETYYMLKTAFEVQKPQVVLLETNLMFRDPGPAVSVKEAAAESLRHHLPIFRFHNLWQCIFNGKKPGEVSYKGFIPRGGVSPFDSGDYMEKTKEVQKIPAAVRIYMEEIRKICRENDADLVLMSAPSPKNYNYKKHNALRDYAEETGLPYFDLNVQTKDLEMNWQTDSYDNGDHLNLNGARKVTAWVGKYLKEKYDLPDHRGKPEYKSWDKEKEKYEKAVRKLSL